MMHFAMEALKNEGKSQAIGTLQTKEEAAEAVKKHAHLTALLGVQIASRNQATARLNAELAGVLAKHQPRIDQTSHDISALEQQLEDWAHDHRREFGGKATIEFSHGFLSFRKGQRKLVCLARWTMEKTLAKLQSFAVTSQWREYIRNCPEVNSQKLLAETKEGGRLPEARLKEIGLKVVQGESFNVEAKPEAVAKDCDLMP